MSELRTWLTGLGLVQSNPVPGDHVFRPDASNAQVIVQKPDQLCNPVQKTHDGTVYPIQPAGPQDHLMCYTIKDDKEGDFPKRKIWIDKTIHQATRIEDYDAKGTNVRSQVRSDYRKDEGPVEHWTPYNIKIVDHRRNDHATEIIMLSSKVNQKVPDDTFSQRSLVRGQ